MGIEVFFGALLAVALVVGANWLVRGGGSDPARPVTPSGPGKTDDGLDLVAAADKIEHILEKAAHPGDILGNEDFEAAVAALASSRYTIDQASNYALGANWVLSCIGYEALARREDSAQTVERALGTISSIYAWPLFFLLRFVGARATDPAAARIVSHAQYWWSTNPTIVSCVGDYVGRQIEAGGKIEFGDAYAERNSDEKDDVRKFIGALPPAVRKELSTRLEEYEGEAFDRNFLSSIGQILNESRVGDPVFDTAEITRLRADMMAELDTGSPRSILIVGPSGVGKSALRRAFARDLLDAGWTVAKTSAAGIIADKVYVGEIEGQVRRLANNANVAKRIAVYIDTFAELSDLGVTKSNSSSVLDQLWPEIESRRMFFVSEASPSGLQALIRRRPSLPTALKVIQMQSVEQDVAEDLAGQLLRHLCRGEQRSLAAEVVAETVNLAQQYLSHKSLPGSVLSLLELAVLRAQREGDETPGREHVFGALSQVSGLPREVLDDEQQLDIDMLRAEFSQRIIGQDEAVECLVERIAMLKAGLTDPSRPVGVFLFAGPTGTGKTEIAKTLAEVLFGSAEQMIRLDMSEYQDADSAWRLLGQDNDKLAAGSLVSRIREKPFSVVLLDEFEKAHAKVWDLFLQVFDDGRLSDIRGEAADFRHAIIILTSNLGATIANEAGIGFTSAAGDFSEADVMRTVNRTFRREFINRLDRVVVFRPLSRDVMRAILRKELGNALERRGFRSKQWAVEWEDSALEFLLSEGFTADLGARPLRRAIERHLLAPLSLTIVQNRAPAGEQFLLVRSNGEQLIVEFIDPDADSDGAADQPAGEHDDSSEIDLPSIVRSSAVGSRGEAFLKSEMDRILQRVTSAAWAENKAAHLAELNQDGFWGRDDRYAVLDRIELIDRLDSAAAVLGSLSNRLRQHPGSATLLARIANRLFVLNEGLQDVDHERPTQAYVGIRLVSDDRKLNGAADFLQDLIRMYRNWGRERGMRIGDIDSSGSRYHTLFLVSGFGSYGLLEPESGLHVLETPSSKGRYDRVRARVQVAPVALGPAQEAERRAQAAAGCLDNAAGKVEIVRRYRKSPSPLARDSVRGWRTGRLDAVLAGHFDVQA
ncbi:MAG: AAA family ATPase [Pseudomonadota bacterium]